MQSSDMIEGPQAYKRFESAMKQVLSVPRDVLKQRIEAERKRSALKTVRPGPKRKPVKPSASPGPAV